MIIKLLNLTQSDQDGESLNAIRKANERLKRLGKRWEDVIGLPSVRPDTSSAQQNARNWGFNRDWQGNTTYRGFERRDNGNWVNVGMQATVFRSKSGSWSRVHKGVFEHGFKTATDAIDGFWE